MLKIINEKKRKMVCLFIWMLCRKFHQSEEQKVVKKELFALNKVCNVMIIRAGWFDSWMEQLLLEPAPLRKFADANALNCVWFLCADLCL